MSIVRGQMNIGESPVTKAVVRALLPAIVLMSGSATFAHHAFYSVYDGERTVTVEGTVREFRFVNPHAHMTLDIVDERDNSVAWNVEFDGVLNLTNGGWTADTIPAGSRVKVTGNPTHSDSPRMFFVSLIFADGTELIRPYDERVDSIDAERRRERERRPTLEFPE